MCSGIVVYLAFLVQPSAFAIAIETATETTSPLSARAAEAVTARSAPCPSDFHVIRLENTPDLFARAIMYCVCQHGLPDTTARFCITVSGSSPIRSAMFSAIRQLGSLPWK
ncbi:hypothetical protein AX289_29925 [Methylorubrum populi]|nr:hypothetical protein AX289_29925 [Methylorubrum populi]